MAAGVLCVAAIVRSRSGVGLRATAHDPRAAAALGFDASRLRLGAFAAAGAIAGVAGALAAQFAGRVAPGVFSWNASVFVAAAALLGCPLAIAGPAVAGYVIGALVQLADVTADVQLLAFATVLLAAGMRDPQYVLTPWFLWKRRTTPDGNGIGRQAARGSPAGIAGL